MVLLYLRMAYLYFCTRKLNPYISYIGGEQSSSKNANADVTASPAKISSQASTGAISKNIQKEK